MRPGLERAGARVLARRRAREARGLCIYCPVGDEHPATHGLGCEACADFNRRKMRARRELAREAG